MSKRKLRNGVHEDIRYTSYIMKKGQFLRISRKLNPSIRSRSFISKLIDSVEDLIRFSSKEKP